MCCKTLPEVLEPLSERNRFRYVTINMQRDHLSMRTSKKEYQSLGVGSFKPLNCILSYFRLKRDQGLLGKNANNSAYAKEFVEMWFRRSVE